MNPTNEQLAEHLQLIGNHLAELEGFIRSIAYTQANQYKLIAAKTSSLSSEEKKSLTDGAQACLDSLEKTKPMRMVFRQAEA